MRVFGASALPRHRRAVEYTTACARRARLSSGLEDSSPDCVKIVTRYILREHLGPLVFALSALTSLLLLNFVAKRFGELVGKGLEWTVIAEFLLLSVPFTLAMTLPMAVLVATLHAFSRFAAENEITAFKASGVSMHVLVRPVILASVVLTIFMVWFNDQVLPRANHRLASLQSDIARVKPTLALNEQVINEVVPGKLYLRAARIDGGTQKMRDVVIYDLADPRQRRTIIADSGQLAFTRNGQDLVLTLHSGSMIELNPQEPERLQRNFFMRDLLKVRGVAAGLDRDQGQSAYRSDRELGVCELRDRVRTASRDRAGVWDRLRRAEADGERPAEPPAVPGGLGAAYCGAIAAVQRWLAPDDADGPAVGMGGSPDGNTTAVASVAGDSAARVSVGRPAGRTLPDARRQRRGAANDRRGDTAAADGPIGTVAPDSEIVRPTRAAPLVIQGLEVELEGTQESIDRYRVEIEKKFAIAAACIVFVLLGAPIALRVPGGGVGLTIGVSLAVFGIYYIGLLGGEALADRNLVGPAVAMWTTNILLGAVGLVLTWRLGSEGSTSRGSETGEWWSRLRDRILRRDAA